MGELFKSGEKLNRTKRNKTIYDAVMLYGYRQKEIANILGFDYSTISRLLKNWNDQK